MLGRLDVAVLGGGIVGVCCALELVKAGKTVCLIDADLDQSGASSGNAGVISPWSVIPQSMPGLWRQAPGWLLDPNGPVAIRPGYAPRLMPWILRFLRAGKIAKVLEISRAMAALNQHNVDLYRDLLSEAGHPDLIEDSYYVQAFRSIKGVNLDRLEYRIREQYGAELELIDGAALRDLEPDVSKDFSGAVLIKGQARARSPGRILEVLRESFVRHGGQTLVTRINTLKTREGGCWAIDTAQGEIQADKVVLALGAWSAKLLGDLGHRVPLEAERGYHIAFESNSVHLRHSVMDVERKLVASSMHEGVRVAGTAEFTGLDKPPTPRRVERLTALARRMLPGLENATCKTWMGHRPSFPDGLPAIGPVPGHPGLIAAFGHSHYGLMMAPKTGRLVRALLIGEVPEIDLNAVRIDRF